MAQVQEVHHVHVVVPAKREATFREQALMEVPSTWRGTIGLLLKKSTAARLIAGGIAFWGIFVGVLIFR